MSEYDHHDPLKLIRLLDTRDARIAELEKESAQWQESSGQNYVRAQEAEAREETLRSEVERLRELLTRVLVAEGRCPVALLADVREALETE